MLEDFQNFVQGKAGGKIALKELLFDDQYHDWWREFYDSQRREQLKKIRCVWKDAIQKIRGNITNFTDAEFLFVDECGRSSLWERTYWDSVLLQYRCDWLVKEGTGQKTNKVVNWPIRDKNDLEIMVKQCFRSAVFDVKGITLRNARYDQQLYFLPINPLWNMSLSLAVGILIN